MSKSDCTYYKSVKEFRDWYFIEYTPPQPSSRFSTLNLVVLEDRNNQTIRKAMERESADWIHRFPVPILTTAFDLTDDVIAVGDTWKSSHLISWVNDETSELICRWEPVSDKLLPDVALNHDFLQKVFAEFPSESRQDLLEKANRKISEAKKTKLLLFIWLIAIPLVWALLEWSSEVLGYAVLAFAIFKAAIHSLRFFGYLPKTKHQLGIEKRELKMRHYFYHCEQNPNGFQRLKNENFKQDAIKMTQTEALDVKSNS